MATKEKAAFAHIERVKEWVYRCSACGQIHLPKNGVLPVRCSNREHCGLVFRISPQCPVR